MSYTLSDNFKYSAKSQSVAVDWAMRLHYYNTDDGNSNSYIGISSKDRIIGSDQYYGIVRNWSNVVKTIDVANSTAQLASFTIECVNKWKNGTFSGELFAQGTNYYVNNKCLLYMGIDDDTTFANWILLGEYRLVNVGHNAQTVTLEFEERTPWDKLSLPREKYGRYYAAEVYGEYTAGTSPFYADAKVWPAPVVLAGFDKVYAQSYPDSSPSGTTTLHVYTKDIDKYIPVDTAGDIEDIGTSLPNDDGVRFSAPSDLRRDFDFYFKESGTSHQFTETGGSFEDILSDGNTGSYSYYTTNMTGPGGTERAYFSAQMPAFEGRFEDLQYKITVAYRCDDQSMSGDTFTYDLYDVTFNDSGSPDEGDASSVVIVSTVTSETPSSGALYTSHTEYTVDIHTADTYQNEEVIPSEIKICMKTTRTGSNGTFHAGTRISKLYCQPIVKMADDNGRITQSLMWYRLDLKYLYSSYDGPTAAWDGALTPAEPQQIHREILQTRVGLAAGDINTTTWSNLDTAKDGWTARFWEVEPTPVKVLLERLQFEGGFIAFWSQQKVKYVWVENDYDSSDVVQDLDEYDYKDLSFSLTPFDEIVTDRIYHHTRDPGTGDTETTEQWPSSPPYRTEYNLDTEEGYEEIDLRYLQDDISGGTNPNDHIGRYYDNILQEPKVIATCRIMNPACFDLEIGDIVQFSDSNIDAFGKTMANVYFMIVEERRQPQQLEITAREVYDST